jgi:penicillin-binding protein 1C
MKKSLYIVITLVVTFVIYPISKPLFESPYSTVLEDRNGALLSAKIADDGQWRFPQGTSVPEKFSTCIRFFEDEYFYVHPGVNPVSIGRALKQNITAGKVVSGGSTLTMQIARLARKNQKRTVWNKLIELFLTFKIEIAFSKAEIMELYVSHAPFGGNVVGLDAASWRYFNRSSNQLSWAEAASLAVLPNAPSLVRPGKNQELLLLKRNRLLLKLNENDIIDDTSYELALLEGLPGKPHALPRHAVHLLNRSLLERQKGKRIRTSLELSLQRRINKIVDQEYNQLRQNEIHNLAVLVIDNTTNEVLSYVGNSNPTAGNNGHKVDIITAKRSTGSLLKPFLYGLAWQDGLLLPNSILADIPSQFGGYAPKNFDKKFDGAVPAKNALTRSLNIPAVRLLQEYNLDRFYDELQQFQLNSVNLGAGHYGLSIILGGAESSLWEICTAYKGMSESLRSVYEREYHYRESDYDFPKWKLNDKVELKALSKETPLESAAIWQLFEALNELNRPGQERGWESFAGRKKVAWKTGTSFGLRDAWAVGVSPDYTVGVWVGNADGEGRPGLTGITAAAPIMLQVFDLLPNSNWYKTPYDELFEVTICAKSGYGKGINCLEADTVLAGVNSRKIKTCEYHQIVQLDSEGVRRVNSSCYEVEKMKTESYFVLPPLMEYYYQKTKPEYRKLPQWDKGCQRLESSSMELISPENAEQILIPIDLDGIKGRLAIQVAHRSADAIIYWNLDEEFIGTTEGIHQKEISPSVGSHTLTLVDSDGNTLVKSFEIIE